MSQRHRPDEYSITERLGGKPGCVVGPDKFAVGLDDPDLLRYLLGELNDVSHRLHQQRAAMVRAVGLCEADTRQTGCVRAVLEILQGALA